MSEAVVAVRCCASVRPPLAPEVLIPSGIGALGEPQMHGVGPAETGAGLEPATANYVEGVPFIWSPAPLFGPLDVERVTILDGPQGTLFGRNAPGGVIELETRAPTQDIHADLQSSYGSCAPAGESGYVTGGLSSTPTASAALLYENQADRFGKNLYNGKDVQNHHAVATRGKLVLAPGAATKFVFGANYYRIVASDPAVRSLGVTLLGTKSPGGARDVDGEIQPDIVDRYWGASITGEHQFDAVVLASISAYRSGKLHVAVDGDGTPENILSIDQNQMLHQFSQEVRLRPSLAGPLQWTVGADYLSSTSGYDPVVASGEFFAGPTTLTVADKLISSAFFGQARYALDSRTHVTVGLRYTIDERSTAEWQTVTINGAAIPNEKLSVEGRTFDYPTWRLAPERDIGRELTAYVSYDRGVQSGSFIANTFPSNLLKPENLDAYWAGVRAKLAGGEVNINLSGFRNDYRDKQVTQLYERLLYALNAPRAHSYGLKATLFAVVTKQLQLNDALDFTHSRYTDFPAAFISTPLAVGGYDLMFGSATGNHMQDTPAVSANLGAVYAIPTAHGSFALAMTDHYNGGYYTEADNRLKQPQYDVLDASVTWTALDKRYTVNLWANNLTNIFYIRELNAL